MRGGWLPRSHYSGRSLPGPSGKMPRARRYCTVIVTGFELTPAIDTTSGWLPVGAFAGTSTFTWYSPTDPGVSPLNRTGASLPPMLAEAAVVVVAGVVDGLASPA